MRIRGERREERRGRCVAPTQPSNQLTETSKTTMPGKEEGVGWCADTKRCLGDANMPGKGGGGKGPGQMVGGQLIWWWRMVKKQRKYSPLSPSEFSFLPL